MAHWQAVAHTVTVVPKGGMFPVNYGSRPTSCFFSVCRSNRTIPKATPPTADMAIIPTSWESCASVATATSCTGEDSEIEGRQKGSFSLFHRAGILPMTFNERE